MSDFNYSENDKQLTNEELIEIAFEETFAEIFSTPISSIEGGDIQNEEGG